MSRPISDRVLAAHVLRMVALDRARGRTSTLDDLSRRIGVRREDVRAVLSKLHREGCFDVVRMKVTMNGFVAACAMSGTRLQAIRRVAPAKRVVAA